MVTKQTRTTSQEIRVELQDEGSSHQISHSSQFEPENKKKTEEESWIKPDWNLSRRILTNYKGFGRMSFRQMRRMEHLGRSHQLHAHMQTKDCLVVIWGCFALRGTGCLVFVWGSMKSQDYWGPLEPNVLLSVSQGVIASPTGQWPKHWAVLKWLLMSCDLRNHQTWGSWRTRAESHWEFRVQARFFKRLLFNHNIKAFSISLLLCNVVHVFVVNSWVGRFLLTPKNKSETMIFILSGQTSLWPGIQTCCWGGQAEVPHIL